MIRWLDFQRVNPSMVDLDRGASYLPPLNHFICNGVEGDKVEMLMINVAAVADAGWVDYPSKGGWVL